jgi:hypothetical protein
MFAADILACQEIAISAREYPQTPKWQDLSSRQHTATINIGQLTRDLELKLRVSSMYCITLRNKFDKTIIGWYDASASNFSTDQRRAKLFVDRVDADAVAYQLRRMYPRLTQDIEVTPAVQTTALVYSFNGRNRVAIV